MKIVKKVLTIIFICIAGSTVLACESTTSKESNFNNEKTTVEETDKDNSTEVLPGNLDSFKKPMIVTDEEVKVYYIHSTTAYESQYRSIWTAKVEAAHRGWTLVDLEYESASEYLDLFNTAVNDSDTTAIICGIVAGFDGYGDVVAEARNKGIGVYSNDNIIIDGVICNSTMPNGVASTELTYQICELYDWDLDYTILTAKAARVHMERSEAFRAIAPLFTNMKELAYDDGSSNSTTATLNSFDIVKAWLEKYEDIEWIFSTNDNNAINAAEAITAAGREDEIFTSGFGGGSSCWQYIRNDTPFKFSYAQPYELMTHNVFQVIEETQVKGIYPGEEGATLSFTGESLYYPGVLVGKSNVPDIGESIHSVFDYYDKENLGEWYNWNDGPGILYVTDGTAQ
ncbi:MAG: sugar ABC transporter substrate-binding protein [Mobilitalea sp.]